jgi:hypothetical protein
MKRYLGLDENEIVDNERMWKEENPDAHKGQLDTEDMTDNLSAVGIRPFDSGGMPDFEGGDDIGEEGEGPPAGPEESPIGGGEGAPPAP